MGVIATRQWKETQQKSKIEVMELTCICHRTQEGKECGMRYRAELELFMRRGRFHKKQELPMTLRTQLSASSMPAWIG